MHDIFDSNSLLFITFIIIFPHHIKQTERQMERYWTTYNVHVIKKTSLEPQYRSGEVNSQHYT